jgi:hypothetical protein
MNDEQFELTINDLARSGTYYADIADELRARDTAQREALARVEAERDAMESMVIMLEEKEWAEHASKGPVSSRLETCITTLINELSEANERADTAQAQLASALALIGEVQSELRTGESYGWEDRLAGKLGTFLAQTEQQEAQGAQAGDERIALLERELDRERERADMAEVELQNARAAQPGAGQFAAAAAFVRNMATDYANEHGWDDMGGLSFGAGPQGTAKMDHFLFLEELAEKLRTMTTEGGAGHA